jgi:N-methylhydantoinase A
MVRYRVGIDIGGTFTDLVYLTPEGGIAPRQGPLDARRLRRGIAEGLGELITRGEIAVRTIAADRARHDGRDERDPRGQGRQGRSSPPRASATCSRCAACACRCSTTSAIRKPPPLVPRRLRFEVPERIDHLGEVERPLDEAAARAVITSCSPPPGRCGRDLPAARLRQRAHEQRVARSCAPRTRHSVTCSSDMLPEIRNTSAPARRS